VQKRTSVCFDGVRPCLGTRVIALSFQDMIENVKREKRERDLMREQAGFELPMLLILVAMPSRKQEPRIFVSASSMQMG
jgi:hypothetical protein